MNTMNKEQYMKELKKRLRKLPKSEFERAIEYYEEYFADAGPEHEQEAISNLGTPEEAANGIIREFAIANANKPANGVKNIFHAIWIGILAVCAAPVALPVMLIWLLVLMVLIIAIIVTVLAIACATISLILTGPISIWGGCSLLTQSFPAALICLGYGLVSIGLGLLLGYLVWNLGKKLVNWLIKMFGKAAEKGEKTNEEK